MNYGSSTAAKKVPSYKELFLINKSTYFALLQKLTPLEKTDIERMNRQTLLPDDDETPKQLQQQQQPPSAAASMNASSGSSGATASAASAVMGAAQTTPDQVPLDTNSSDDVFDDQGQHTEDADGADVPTVTDHDTTDAGEVTNEVTPDTVPPQVLPPEAPPEEVLPHDEPPPVPQNVPPPGPPHPALPPEALLGPPLPELKKGKKAGHQMPHIVTLKNNPETLITQVHPTPAAPPPPSTTTTTTTPPAAPVVPPDHHDHQEHQDQQAPLLPPAPQSKKPKTVHKCQECGAEFKAEWKLFKHATSVHDDSDYARDLIIARENSLQDRRSSLRLKNQAAAHAATMSSKSAATAAATKAVAAPKNRGGRTAKSAAIEPLPGQAKLPAKAKVPSGPLQPGDVVAASLAASGPNLTTKQRRAKSTKTSVAPYTKKKPGRPAKTTKTQDTKKATGKAKSSATSKTKTSTAMDAGPPDLVRSTVAAGRKRSAKVANATATTSSSAKRKLGTVAVPGSLKGAKKSKSMFSNKRSKDRRYDDSDSDDDYDIWNQ